MKAIIVFDVHEFTYEAIKEWFTGDIILHMGNDGFIEFKDAILQPMPQAKTLPNWQVVGTNYGEEPWFSDGWNACIETILGETE